MSEEQLTAIEFFGYTVWKFSGEVHSICYNEYLGCVRKLSEKLAALFPDRQEEIHQQCTSLLVAFSRRLDEYMAQFMQYYQKNFRIPAQVPVYGEEIEQARGVGEKLKELQHRIAAVNLLNRKLLERVSAMKEEVNKRETLLHTVREIVKGKEELEQAKQLLDELRNVKSCMLQERTAGEP